MAQKDEGRDFRGPAVHGKRGERFLYLTWGTVSGDEFTMFRRAKLMLSEAPADVSGDQALVATVALTDEKGLPRCARVRAPHIQWSVVPLPPVPPLQPGDASDAGDAGGAGGAVE